MYENLDFSTCIVYEKFNFGHVFDFVISRDKFICISCVGPI